MEDSGQWTVDDRHLIYLQEWSRSTMDSIRVSEAPDSGSIPDGTALDYNEKVKTRIKFNVYAGFVILALRHLTSIYPSKHPEKVSKKVSTIFDTVCSPFG